MKKNKFKVNYNKKKLTIHFEGEKFKFDLTEGDVGDFWHSFTMMDGTIKDINFSQEDYDDTPCVSIFGVKEDGGGHLTIDMFDEILIEEHKTKGNPLNYFDWHDDLEYTEDGHIKKACPVCEGSEHVQIIAEDGKCNTCSAEEGEKDDCPNCASEEVFKNSCGEVQCDNCGYDEGND